MAIWKAHEFQNQVLSTYGQDRLNEALPIMQAIGSKFMIVKLHFSEVEEAFDGMLEEAGPEITDILGLLFSNGERRQSFGIARLKYEANLVAAAQATHSISDNLAHLIYTTFHIPHDENYRPKLQQLNKDICEGQLKGSIERLLGMREYRYLQDFANYNKHMSLVSSAYHISTPSDFDLKHGVRFKAFKAHVEKWGDEFLHELKAIHTAQIGIGICINESIGQMVRVGS
jgi:hypothetical protein